MRRHQKNCKIFKNSTDTNFKSWNIYRKHFILRCCISCVSSSIYLFKNNFCRIVKPLEITRNDALKNGQHLNWERFEPHHPTLPAKIPTKLQQECTHFARRASRASSSDHDIQGESCPWASGYHGLSCWSVRGRCLRTISHRVGGGWWDTLRMKSKLSRVERHKFSRVSRVTVTNFLELIELR